MRCVIFFYLVIGCVVDLFSDIFYNCAATLSRMEINDLLAETFSNSIEDKRSLLRLSSNFEIDIMHTRAQLSYNNCCTQKTKS